MRRLCLYGDDTARLQERIVLRDAGLVHPAGEVAPRLHRPPLLTAHVEEPVVQLEGLPVHVGLQLRPPEVLVPVRGAAPAVGDEEVHKRKIKKIEKIYNKVTFERFTLEVRNILKKYPNKSIWDLV